jgi:hypothetical protein
MTGGIAVAVLIAAAAGVCAEKPKEPDPKISATIRPPGSSGATFVNPDHGRDQGSTCWSLVLSGGGIKVYDTPIGRHIKIANSLDDTTAEPLRERL